MFESLFEAQSDAAFWKERYEEKQEVLNRALEARKDLLRELADAINQNRDYEKKVSELWGEIDGLAQECDQLDDVSQALADENRDLVRQLELYKALLKQVRINVTLPARKK